MENSYYVVFYTYDEAMRANEIFKGNNLDFKISPTPRLLQEEAGCGISILASSFSIEQIKKVIKDNNIEVFKIAQLDNQINPKRDKFC